MKLLLFLVILLVAVQSRRLSHRLTSFQCPLIIYRITVSLESRSPRPWLTEEMYDLLWEKQPATHNYETDREACTMVLGRNCPSWYHHFCTIFMSWAWNEMCEVIHTRHPEVPDCGIRNRHGIGGAERDSKGRYIFRGVAGLTSWIRRNYGPPHLCDSRDTLEPRGEKPFIGLKGLVMFGGRRSWCPDFSSATGHFDVYNGEGADAPNGGCRNHCVEGTYGEEEFTDYFTACRKKTCMYVITKPNKCFDVATHSYYGCVDSAEACTESVVPNGFGCPDGKVCCNAQGDAPEDEKKTLTPPVESPNPTNNGTTTDEEKKTPADA